MNFPEPFADLAGLFGFCGAGATGQLAPVSGAGGSLTSVAFRRRGSSVDPGIGGGGGTVISITGSFGIDIGMDRGPWHGPPVLEAATIAAPWQQQ